MEKHDLKSISQISNGLWANKRLSQQKAIEALGAVCTLELTDQIAVQKTIDSILLKAAESSSMANQKYYDHPFFRLIPEERLALIALHYSHWSYNQVARALNLSNTQIAHLLWNARLRLANSSEKKQKKPLTHPMGSHKKNANCPEYSPHDPWTQRFLDEELSTTQRLFLQNHLMACENCRRSLNAARDLYYAVDDLLPLHKSESYWETEATQLEKIYQKIYKQSNLSARPFFEVFKTFLKQPKILIPIILFLGFVVSSFF